MERLVQYTNRNPAYYDEAGAEKYYAAQRKVNDARRELNRLLEIERLSQTEDTQRRPFINGWGEAGTREITSAAWERHQRRAKKEIEIWTRGHGRK